MNKKEFIKIFTSGLRKLNKKDVDANYLMQLKYENLPNSLFKYCSFDENNRNVSNLKKDIVWMNSPLNFNDPYEFTYSVNLEKVLEHEYSNKINIFADIHISDFSVDDLNKMVNDSNSYDVIIENLVKAGKIAKAKIEDFEAKYIGVIKQSIDNDDIKKMYKVSSFAEKNDLLLMWSHYAQNHTGFCIEYDINSLPFDSLITERLYPIVYSDELFDTTDYYLQEKVKTQNIDYLLEGMLRKSLEWEYEKEWRLVVLDTSEVGVEFNMPKAKSIYLGSEFDVDNLKKLYNFCKDNNINLYHMKLDKSEYKLTPKKLI